MVRNENVKSTVDFTKTQEPAPTVDELENKTLENNKYEEDDAAEVIT